MASHLFSALFSHHTDRSRVAFETEDGVRHSYGDIEAASARMAGALLALGIAPGDRVAAQIEKSLDAVILYLGCIRAGAVFLPLNTAYTPAEIRYFLSDAEPALFVCSSTARTALAPVARTAGVTRIETMDADGTGTLRTRARGMSDIFTDAARGPDDLAGVLYTSGTTGRSKGAMISHANLASNARTLAQIWRFTPDDVLIHALPIYHTHGLFVAINTLLIAGGSMIFLHKFDADQVLSLMPRATSLMGVPTFYTRLLQHAGLTRAATSAMRLFISGSAPLLAETHTAWSARTGHAILERYGMTETNMITSNPYDGPRIPGTVGFPLPDVALRITSPDTGSALEKGETGMIEVKGPNVFSGYWRMPEKTREEFRADGFFITGDLARIDENDYVHIVGRGKDLVISGGFNVYPKEVEGEIDAMPGVLESAVIGLAHPDFGEGVTAIVVREKGADITGPTITGALEQRLAKYKMPKKILFLDELPRNAMGKVQKNVLREKYRDLYGK